MNDGMFLDWLHNRLQHQIKVDPRSDYMLRLKSIAQNKNDVLDFYKLQYDLCNKVYAETLAELAMFKRLSIVLGVFTILLFIGFMGRL